MVELFAKTYKFDMKLWIFGFQCFVNRFTWVKISGFRLNVTRTTEKYPKLMEPNRKTRKTCTRTGTGCDPKITGSFACYLFLNPNRPGPGRNRPEPKFSQVPIGYKFSRPERPGPERNRPEPDPKIRMPRPMCT